MPKLMHCVPIINFLQLVVIKAIPVASGYSDEKINICSQCGQFLPCSYYNHCDVFLVFLLLMTYNNYVLGT